jgi:hypothetical protein
MLISAHNILSIHALRTRAIAFLASSRHSFDEKLSEPARGNQIFGSEQRSGSAGDSTLERSSGVLVPCLLSSLGKSGDEVNPMRPISESEVLGTLNPVGGGDPMPLTKPELVVGRRPGCDIRLDFENISGKHCVLRFLNGIWMVRDLGSTNGTTVNGAPISSEQSVMADEEIGIAGHLYKIDYVPAGPDAFLSSHKDLDEEVVQERAAHSLMDLAGLDTDTTQQNRPKRAPTVIERLSVDEAEFDDAVPDHFKQPAKPKKQPTDDDFFKIIEDDVKKPSS